MFTRTNLGLQVKKKTWERIRTRTRISRLRRLSRPKRNKPKSLKWKSRKLLLMLIFPLTPRLMPKCLHRVLLRKTPPTVMPV